MIRSLIVTNHLDETITLDLQHPERSGLVVTNVEGLGPATANINTTELATMDGSRYNSSRKTQRNVVIHLDFRASDDVETARQLTYKYFPVKHYVILTVVSDNRKSMLMGYVESNEPDIFSEYETATISIICPDPNVYAVDDDMESNVIFSGTVSNFEFPFDNNSIVERVIELGDVQRKRRETITYNGDSDVGIVIIIHATGNVENVTIFNINSRETIYIDTDKLKDLTGDIITYGDTITINTRAGEKSAILLRDGEEYNILNCIGKNAAWFTIGKGDNVFAFDAEVGNEMIQFTIEWQSVYEGV
jgi:hypothetical protein